MVDSEANDETTRHPNLVLSADRLGDDEGEKRFFDGFATGGDERRF